MILRAAAAIALGVALAGCTLSRPEYAAPDVRVGEPAFVRALEAHTMGGLIDGNRVDLLLNGDEIFPAMLAAIRGATTTITFANFIYEDGDIAREMAEALAERCRAGVGVNILLDAVGSGDVGKPLRELWRSAGCHFAFFHAVNPFTIRRLNHRNHRRILVIDGQVGFTGGTGVGEKWTGNGRRKASRRKASGTRKLQGKAK